VHLGDERGTRLHGGATVILSEHGSMVGPGGQPAYRNDLAHHYYDAARNGDFRLSIGTIGWDRHGWPHLSTQPDPARRAEADEAQRLRTRRWDP
jgi:hypothetical protein